jgi:hypothetical protein
MLHGALCVQQGQFPPVRLTHFACDGDVVAREGHPRAPRRRDWARSRLLDTFSFFVEVVLLSIWEKRSGSVVRQKTMISGRPVGHYPLCAFGGLIRLR